MTTTLGHTAAPVTRKSTAGEIAFELASRQTGMAYQRTRLSADQTLMSVIRTSLSLIGFGFTIFQFFERLRVAGTLSHAGAPRNFGLTLVVVGVVMLVVGIAYHLQFMFDIRRSRAELIAAGLMRGRSRYPVSFTLLIALILLFIGLMAIASMVFNVGLFIDPAPG